VPGSDDAAVADEKSGGAAAVVMFASSCSCNKPGITMQLHGGSLRESALTPFQRASASKFAAPLSHSAC
jgi:hypothetical protein